MSAPIIAIEQYEKLMPVAEKLYQHTDGIAQMALLPLFLLSICFAYSKDLGIQGAIAARLKRLVITALLLAAFPTLSGLIKTLGQEVALSIDNLEGLDEFLDAASKKAGQYSASVKSLLDFGNDLLISLFVTASFLILYFARFCLVAFYHFYWLFLLVTAPLFILCNLFEGTGVLTKNLFKNITLVAAWPIVWSILSAFLKGLPFADAYATEGGYLTVCVMNLILAVALLLSPFMLNQFCEGLVVGSGSAIYQAGRAAISTIAPKLGAAMSATGKKVYPRVQKHLPSREAMRSGINRAGSRTRSIILILGFLMGTNSFSQEAINIHPGQSTLFCLDKTPDDAVLTGAKFFEMMRAGPHLILTSFKELQKTTLMLFFGKEAKIYEISSNSILPHALKYNCDKKEASLPKTVKTSPKKRVVPSLGVSILSVNWTNARKDYLTLYLQISNDSRGVLIPEWNKVTLKQDGKVVKFHRMKAQRQEIPAGASIKVSLDFKTPSLDQTKAAYLIIPSNKSEMLALLKKGTL